ncbi:nucleoside hydrolase [Halobacillus andaensis]|uniref:nucleoside hydrolase n=1 Tax=Halobacillus andaensis TaxID=1176239 RepID=UPI003D70821F
MEKVLIVADPGVDDAFAIIYALLHPDIEVAGIINEYGNVSQEDAVRNTWYLLKIADKEEIPIILGAHQPLTGNSPEYFYNIHGVEGLGSVRPRLKDSITVFHSSKFTIS